MAAGNGKGTASPRTNQKPRKPKIAKEWALRLEAIHIQPTEPTGGLAAMEKRRRKANRRTCSDAWAEDVVDRGVRYPPPASNQATAMHVCTDRPCGGNGTHRDGTPEGKRAFPFYYLRADEFGDVCLDCVEARRAPADRPKQKHISTTSSPTALAIKALEDQGARLEESALPPEDEKGILQEILKKNPNWRKTTIQIDFRENPPESSPPRM